MRYLHALAGKCVHLNILSRALGAFRMRILKVMTLSMMHKDHSLELSPRGCILRLRLLRLSGLSRLFLQDVHWDAEQRAPASPQPVQPTTGASVRTDGREKAALAWTVTRQQPGRTHRDTDTKKPARIVYNRWAFNQRSHRGWFWTRGRETRWDAALLLQFSRTRTSRHFTEKQRQLETHRISRRCDTNDERFIIPSR